MVFLEVHFVIVRHPPLVDVFSASPVDVGNSAFLQGSEYKDKWQQPLQDLGRWSSESCMEKRPDRMKCGFCCVFRRVFTEYCGAPIWKPHG